MSQFLALLLSVLLAFSQGLGGTASIGGKASVGGGSVALSWISVQTPATCTSAGVALACVYGSNVTSGNLLIYVTLSNLTISSVSDTRGNTWSNSVTCTSPGGNVMQAFYTVNGSTGADTVTTSGTPFADGAVYEFSGNVASSPLDTAGTCASYTAVTTSNASVTTTTNGALLFAVNRNDSGATITTSSGCYTRTTINSGNGEYSFYNTSQPASGSQTITMNYNFSSNGIGVLLSFKL
jgi:hypothetical protein